MAGKQRTAPVEEIDVAGHYQYELMVLSLILEHRGIMESEDVLAEVTKIRDAANRLLSKHSASTKSRFGNVVSIVTVKKWF